MVASDTERYLKFEETTGLTEQDWFSLNDARSSMADGRWSHDELESYLRTTGYSRSEKAGIWDMIFPNAKSNPYK
jgi:hypothetical protein